MVKNIFDKPTEYFNLDKLRNTLGVDRRISVKELIDYTLGFIPYIKSKQELLEEEYEKFDDRYLPKDEEFSYIKDFFTTYILDEELQDIIETKQFSPFEFSSRRRNLQKPSQRIQNSDS